jgi:molybdopterin biosynthesis enzyme
LGEPVTNPGDRRHFLRVRMDAEGMVWLAGAQGSHVLGSLARAHGLLDVPAGGAIPAGALVLVQRWDC